MKTRVSRWIKWLKDLAGTGHRVEIWTEEDDRAFMRGLNWL